MAPREQRWRYLPDGLGSVRGPGEVSVWADRWAGFLFYLWRCAAVLAVLGLLLGTMLLSSVSGHDLAEVAPHVLPVVRVVCLVSAAVLGVVVLVAFCALQALRRRVGVPVHESEVAMVQEALRSYRLARRVAADAADGPVALLAGQLREDADQAHRKLETALERAAHPRGADRERVHAACATLVRTAQHFTPIADDPPRED